MRFGLGLPQSRGFDLRYDVTTLAREAETAGYASLWVYERVLFPQHPADGMNGNPGVAWLDYYQECADAMTVLTLAAAVTERVRLGTSVLVAPLYPPLHLARAFAALDRASGGRVIAGFGGGWSSDEYRGMGADFARRGRALEETVDACRAIWGADPVTYQDQRMSVTQTLLNPKPAGRIPIMIGGGRTRRALDRIARKADGWLPTAMPGAAVKSTWATVRDLAESHGRDPDELELIPRTGVVLSDGPVPGQRRPFFGSREQVVEDVAEMAGAGVPELLLDLSPSARDGAHLVDLALEVLALLRKAGL